MATSASSKPVDIQATMCVNDKAMRLGKYYKYSDYVAIAGVKTSVLKWLITTPDDSTDYHLVWEVSATSAVLFQIIENPTVSDAGAAATELNKNRNSSNTTSVVVTKTPTTSAGTTLLSTVIGSGNRAGGAGEADTGWALKQNEQTLIQITVILTDNPAVSLELEWHGTL